MIEGPWFSSQKMRTFYFSDERYERLNFIIQVLGEKYGNKLSPSLKLAGTLQTYLDTDQSWDQVDNENKLFGLKVGYYYNLMIINMGFMVHNFASASIIIEL